MIKMENFILGVLAFIAVYGVSRVIIEHLGRKYPKDVDGIEDICTDCGKTYYNLFSVFAGRHEHVECGICGHCLICGLHFHPHKCPICMKYYSSGNHKKVLLDDDSLEVVD